MTTKGPFKFIYSAYLDVYKSETKQMFSFTEVSPEDLRLGSRVQKLVRSRRRRIPGGQCGAWRGGADTGAALSLSYQLSFLLHNAVRGRSPHTVRHIPDWPAGPAPSCTLLHFPGKVHDSSILLQTRSLIHLSQENGMNWLTDGGFLCSISYIYLHE